MFPNAQGDYGRILQQLPNSKLKCEISVFLKYLYEMSLSIEMLGKTNHPNLIFFFFLINELVFSEYKQDSQRLSTTTTETNSWQKQK